MKRILFTGFVPFGADTRNASWEAVQRLPDTIGGFVVRKALLPVSYHAVEDALRQLLRQERPSAVVCVGQAAGRTAVTPELVAVNWRSGSLPDNDGVEYHGEKIDPARPDAYFSTLPVRELTSALCAAGIPASLSLSAGAYVCNSTMYHLLALTKGTVPAGFVHLPYLTEQAAQKPNVPSLPLETLANALRILAEALVSYL